VDNFHGADQEVFIWSNCVPSEDEYFHFSPQRLWQYHEGSEPAGPSYDDADVSSGSGGVGLEQSFDLTWSELMPGAETAMSFNDSQATCTRLGHTNGIHTRDWNFGLW
jgi:hypothetical protein